MYFLSISVLTSAPNTFPFASAVTPSTPALLFFSGSGSTNGINAVTFDPLPQRVPIEQLRHDVRSTFMRANVVDGQDVGMVERRRGARLLLEPREAVGIGRERHGQRLDRHLPSEARVARAVHLAHAAGPDGGLDFVRSDASTRTERHQLRRTGRIVLDRGAQTSSTS